MRKAFFLMFLLLGGLGDAAAQSVTREEIVALLAKGPSKGSESAKELGLDNAAFNQCLDSGRYAQKVEGETGIGKVMGVRGTPAFFINGELLVGAQPYETFQLLIEGELEKAKSAKSPSRR
jgi:2-hydroxychromene-2-carboxylate isomerase